MKNGSKRILIAGAGSAAWWNAGDEAIFSAMLADLRAKLQDPEISVLSANPPGVLHDYDVEEIPFSDIGKLIACAKESDLLILGGGGLFYDYWGFNVNELLNTNHVGHGVYVDFALLATLLNKPLMLYAVGVGPLMTEIGRSFTKMIFQQAQQITVRDVGSKNTLIELGIPADEVQVTADPVFGAQEVPAEIGRQYIQKRVGSVPQAPILGVSVRAWTESNARGGDWGPAVAQALDQFLERYGGTILFIPFHKQVDNVNDTSESERVRLLMKYADRAFLVDEGFSTDEKVSIIRCCDLMLGMRLHSLIFAIRYGIPVVGLAYDPKVSQVLVSLQREEYLLDLAEINDQALFEALQSAYGKRSELSPYYREQSIQLASLARQNAKLAAELLQNGLSSPSLLVNTAGEVVKSLLVDQSLRVYHLENRLRILSGLISQRDKTIASTIEALNHTTEVLNHTTEALNHTTEVLNHTTQLLNHANQTLNEIMSSLSWKVITTLWKIRLALAPSGSQREKIFFLLKNFTNRGFRFLSKLVLRKDTQNSTLEQPPAEEDHVSASPDSSLESEERPQAEEDSVKITPSEIEEQYVVSTALEEKRIILQRTVGKERVILAVPTFFDFEGNNMFFGGAERYLLELVRLVRSLGYDVEVYQCATSDWVRYYKDVCVIGLNVQGDMEKFNLEFHRLIKEGMLTIYFAFFLAYPDYFSTPSIGISHGVYWDDKTFQITSTIEKRWTEKILDAFSHISCIVSVDTNTINWVRGTNWSLADRFMYIPNFVDPEQFYPLFEPRRKADDEKIIVLYPRRLYGPRGFWLVEKLIPEFLKEYPNLVFHFVGKANPQEEVAVRSLIADYPGQVEWYFLSPERMHEAYQKADITLIPTKNSEGTSLSCLEAMACGNAVIATNIGGLPDLILSNYNGILIEPAVDSLREALHTLLRNPDLRVMMVRRGIEVAKSFSIERWRQQWKKALQVYLPEKPPSLDRPLVAVFPVVPNMKWEQGGRSRYLAMQLAKHGIEVYWQNPSEQQASSHPYLHVITDKDDLYLERPFLFLSSPYHYKLLEQYDHPVVIYDVPKEMEVSEAEFGSVDTQAYDYHQRLLDKADLVLAASRRLTEQLMLRRLEVIYLPMAANDEETVEAFVMDPAWEQVIQPLLKQLGGGIASPAGNISVDIKP